MRRCFPWPLWTRKSAGQDLRRSSEDAECKTIQIERPKSDATLAKQDGLAEITERIRKEFEVSDDDVQRITNGFVKQMSTWSCHDRHILIRVTDIMPDEGLRNHGTAIEQLPSFITRLPTGRENVGRHLRNRSALCANASKGTYLAVDMGGTNVRVCAVTFNGDGTYSMMQDKVTIPPALMISKIHRELFDWVAQMLQAFLEKYQPGPLSTAPGSAQSQSTATFDLGFTFSHAVQQKSINSGTLVRWSKGFDINNVVGQDVCALLQEAFDTRGLPIRVTALTNDTVGTLLAQAYVKPSSARTVLGAVFGTGTNGAYIEEASKITKQDFLATDPEGLMIVNTEWGNFDQRLEFLSMTAYDCAIDAASVNPGFEMFEKQISGMYLGELLRLAVLSLFQDPSLDILEGMKLPKTSGLHVAWSLDTSFLSRLESDRSLELSMSRSYIEQWFGVAHVTLNVASAVKTIAHAIVRRSARLSAVALGAVLVQTDCVASKVESEDRVSIGVDGSLIELYPGFTSEIRRALRSIEQVGKEGEAQVDIIITKDGSGVGAALAAHIASRASRS